MREYPVVGEDVGELCRHYLYCWYRSVGLVELSVMMKANWLLALVPGSGHKVCMATISRGPADGNDSNPVSMPGNSERSLATV